MHELPSAPVSPTLKTCAKCQKVQLISHFCKRTKNEGGLSIYCKDCTRAWDVEYRSKNIDKLEVARRVRYAENADTAKQYSRDWYNSNSEKAKANKAANYAANPSKEKARVAAWALANRDKVREYRAVYRIANAERCKAVIAAWKAINPDAARAQYQKRRALKRNALGVISKGIEARLFSLQKGKCPCCHEPLGQDYHLDHILPFALGGRHEDSNFQLLRANCNLKKHADVAVKLTHAVVERPSGIHHNDDSPNTRQQAQQATAVMRRMYPDDRAAYERGEGVSVFTKCVRLEVIDFYQTNPEKP